MLLISCKGTAVPDKKKKKKKKKEHRDPFTFKKTIGAQLSPYADFARLSFLGRAELIYERIQGSNEGVIRQ